MDTTASGDSRGDLLQEVQPIPSIDTNSEIQQRLLELISRQKLASGDRLPSQRALAESLHVSQVALREAMRSLEALGIIGVKNGLGWYVSAFSFESVKRGLAFSLKLDITTLDDLREVRALLEHAFFELAVRRLTTEDLDALRRLVDDMDRSANLGKDVWQEDYHFHRILFSKIPNKVFLTLMDIFWELVHPFSIALPLALRENLLRNAQEHRLILDALCDGQIELARSRLMDSLTDGVWVQPADKRDAAD